MVVRYEAALSQRLTAETTDSAVVMTIFASARVESGRSLGSGHRPQGCSSKMSTPTKSEANDAGTSPARMTTSWVL